MDAPIRNNTRIGTYTCLIVGGVAVLIYLLRVIARLPVFGAGWGLDDWVITAATIIIVPLTVCAELLNQIGLGKDMWEVPFDNITKILEIFYFTELLYLTAIGLTKISILLFYLRIFPQQRLRRAIYVTIVLCVLYIIAFVTATGLQCLPIHIAWEHWDGEHHGTCINLNADAWASAGVNIVLDLVVIILPIREVSKLSMSRRRRFGVMIMFLLGGFVTIISILRLKYMVQFAHTQNVTWDYLPIGIWSAVECHVGLIVACMPAIRSLGRSLRDRLFPKPATTKSYYEDNPRSYSKKNSRKSASFRGWSSKTALSTLTGSKLGKEDFVELDEYETRVGTETKSTDKGNKHSANNLSQGSMGRFQPSLQSNEGIQPLAPVTAPNGQALSGIMVQTEYSVDRTSFRYGQDEPDRRATRRWQT